MRFKLLGAMAALLLIAGCETPPDDDGNTNTGGSSDPVVQDPVQPVDTGKQQMDPNDALAQLGDRVFFDFDKSDLRPDAIETLNRQAEFLNANGALVVAIEGHADERGTREYNLALGERRASSAKQYLESMGVDGGRMSTVSYGKERPAVLGSNESAWAQNRRAVTVVKSGELSS